mmetsp:Transcript_37731/g.46735  ORF Transcript_37731/g.46735 Transcript_37731/m.46735 type:complete len:166 (-) Transcript_37731:20-517(-)
MKLPALLARYQPHVDTIQKTIETHQNLIWGTSIVSGICVGWASYSSRKYHQGIINAQIHSVNERLENMETTVANKLWYRVTLPTSIACLLIGYGIGRGYGSYRIYRWHDSWKTQFIDKFGNELSGINKYTTMEQNSLKEMVTHIMTKNGDATYYDSVKTWIARDK